MNAMHWVIPVLTLAIAAFVAVGFGEIKPIHVQNQERVIGKPLNLFTAADLKLHDGKNGDGTIYLSIEGRVDHGAIHLTKRYLM